LGAHFAGRISAKQFRIVSIAAVILACAAYTAAQPCTRHEEPDGGFSICIPEGWTVRETPTSKFKSLFAPKLDGFSPNINFRQELTSKTLTDYVSAGVALVMATKEKIGLTSIEPLGQSDFKTDSGLKGIRVIFKSDYKGIMVRTTQYYFDAGNDRKLVITATALDQHKAVFDVVFERAAKSFQLQ
jgi:hypothetical protein